MDMSKYRALFVEESREHLSTLSRLLTELEPSAERGALIDDAFRHSHTLKGMAASMGYDPITVLAHRMEDIIDRLRRDPGVVSSALVDLLLRTTDALSRQVEAIARQESLAEEVALVRELGQVAQALLESAAARPTPMSAPVVATTVGVEGAAVSAPVAGTSAGAAEVAVEASGPRVAITVKIAETSTALAARAFLIHRRLAQLGKIVAARPTLAEIKAGAVSEHTLELELVTERSLDEVRTAALGVADVETAEVRAGTSALREGSQPLPSAAQREAGAIPAAPGERGSRATLATVPTVRVRTDVLDSLVDAVGELFIVRARLRNVLGTVSDPEARAALDELDGRIRDVHSQAMSVRMTPLRTLMDRYPRLVRELAKALGKEVELELGGGDIELDRAILEGLDGPLVHVLRNAVDHGIERSDERTLQGKRPAGRLKISAVRDRDAVYITVEDDGRGIDSVALRDAAVAKGIVTRAQADALSAGDALFLICVPGFSTKTEVSDVSGRGVGMDVVRAQIESLGGTLDIDSAVGRGTRFVLKLPLTLAIVNVLLVEVAQQKYAIPIAKVMAVKARETETIEIVGTLRYLERGERLTPLVDLAHVLAVSSEQVGAQLVLLEDGRDEVALAVDRVVGYHEVVVKPLGEPLDRMAWFSGATVLGDGQPILILDVPKALRSRQAA